MSSAAANSKRKNPPGQAMVDGDTAPALPPLPKRNRPTHEDIVWNQKFFELMLYKATYGDLNVKNTDQEHKSLYKWIAQQRKEFRHFRSGEGSTIINEDRIRVFESIQFTFSTRGDENWAYHFEQLQRFKEKQGHVLVPRISEFRGLGDWVVSQRMQHSRFVKGEFSHMTPYRKSLLDELGLVWQVRDRPAWQTRYEELVEYKKKFGDTRVPQNYVENKALGKWVAKQREQYKFLKTGKKSFLTPDRVDALEHIDFFWSLKVSIVDV